MRFDLIMQQRLWLGPTLAILLATGSCARAPKSDAGPVDQATRTVQSPTPAKNSQQPADSRPVIVTFGDSLTAGFGADPGQSYPDYLQQALDRLGYNYRVVNEGVSGDTTSGGLSRVDQVTALKPSVVVLELGGNDGLRGIPVQNIRDNLSKIIEELKRTHAHIVLAEMTLPTNYGQDYIKEFEQLYRDLASHYNLRAFTFPFRDLAERNMMQADGIHLTPQGNQVVAQALVKSLKPLLERPK